MIMKKYDEFLKNAKLNYMYTKENNIDKANTYARKLFEIIKELEVSGNYAEFLDKAMFCENDTAVIWSCGMSIDRNYREDDAIAELNRLSGSEDEIISRNAWMALQVRQCKF